MNDLYDELKKISQRERLLEMAKSLKGIEDELTRHLAVIIKHLYKLFVLKDQSNMLHWSTEIYEFLPSISLCKKDNKFPSYRFIYDTITKNQLDKFDYTLNSVERSVQKKYQKKINNDYNRDELKTIYKEYCQYIAKVLSKEGVLDFDEFLETLVSIINKHLLKSNFQYEL